MLKSITKAALSPVAKNLRTIPGLRRSFTKLDATAQSFIVFSNDITINEYEDYAIEVSFYFTSQTIVLLGNRDNVHSRLRAISDGSIRWESNDSGTQSATPTGTLTPNKVHTIELQRIGHDVTIKLNGNIVLTETIGYAGPATYGQIGRAFNYPPTGGMIFNVRMWRGGGSLSGTKVLDMPLDGPDYSSNKVVMNSCVNLGPEKLTDPFFHSGSHWSGNNHSFDMQGITVTSGTPTAARGTVFQTHNMEIGKTYLINVDLSDTDNGVNIAVRPAFASGDLLATIYQSEDLSFIYTHSDSSKTTLHVQCIDGSSGYFTLRSISIREVPPSTPLARPINIITSDTRTFTRYGRIWKSDNLLNNGDFTDGSAGWSFAEGWTVENQRAKRDGDPSNDGIQQEDIFVKDSHYELTLFTQGRTQGNLFAYIGQGTQTFGINSVTEGYQTRSIISDNVQTKLLINGTNGFDGYVDNVTVRELLEVSS